ncbi:MAG: FemAB family XrtA/PEP-CTERM system-associated protein [Hyphococcus sp.]
MGVAAQEISPDAGAAPLIVVSLMADSDRDAWDRYVMQHPEGTFFHLTGWGRLVEAAYGYEPLYLCARIGDEVAGVLPLTDVRAPLLGRSLVSTAFSVGGGPIGNSPEVVSALLRAAVGIGEGRKVRHIEVRGGDAAPGGWLERTGVYASFEIPIFADAEEQLSGIPRKRRADVRKAIALEQSGDLRIRTGHDPAAFYALYARSLRAHGTPVFPERFLRELLDAFQGRTEMSFVDYQGAPVCGLVSFFFKDAVMPYYVGATNTARSCYAFDLLYWSTMRRAAERGFARFDFGRSRLGTGPYRYKTLWGATPRPLTYYNYLIGAQTAPSVTPNSPKFRRLSRLWPHLPLFVANRLGPIAAPNFP